MVAVIVLAILALLYLLQLSIVGTPLSGTFPSLSGKLEEAATPPGPDAIIVDEAPDACPGYGPLELAQPYYENLDHVRDKDWYVFAATANTVYTIQLGDLENKADTILYLYDSGCTDPDPLENDNCTDDDPYSGSCITWQAPDSGNYHIYVRNRNWYTDYGPNTGYTLVVREGQ
jgi:hypothetical protein